MTGVLAADIDLRLFTLTLQQRYANAQRDCYC
jgi:hypothetical protein